MSIVEQLNRDFVNAWVLARDLPALVQSEDAAVQSVARRCQEHFLYPVDSLVLTPSGDFVDGLWVEDAMLFRSGGKRPEHIQRPAPSTSGGPTEIYQAFLEGALRKFRDGTR